MLKKQVSTYDNIMKFLNILLGSLLISFGLFFTIIYLNLLVIGYTFWEFVYFIIRSGIIVFYILGLFVLFMGRGRCK